MSDRTPTRGGSTTSEGGTSASSSGWKSSFPDRQDPRKSDYEGNKDGKK